MKSPNRCSPIMEDSYLEYRSRVLDRLLHLDYKKVSLTFSWRRMPWR